MVVVVLARRRFLDLLPLLFHPRQNEEVAAAPSRSGPCWADVCLVFLLPRTRPLQIPVQTYNTKQQEPLLLSAVSGLLVKSLRVYRYPIGRDDCRCSSSFDTASLRPERDSNKESAAQQDRRAWSVILLAESIEVCLMLADCSALCRTV